MGNPRGFIDVERKDAGYRPVYQRIRDYKEVEKRLSPEEIKLQSSRCMDCGIPFCHGCGCPLGNIVPEFNDLVYSGRWKEALQIIYSSNNFPEFTGRICPALCEAACTSGLNGDPVSIRQIELAVIEKGYEDGIIKPEPPEKRTGKKVAVVGSGPAGLATADDLNKMGHSVTVFERERNPGGLLRYGIPDFKLDKRVIDRRVEIMKREGIIFETHVNIGSDISARFLMDRFDAVCITCGAKIPRDLPVPGRELKNVHFAMDFLWQQNCRVSGEKFEEKDILASGLKVLVIGGGDTGSDCVGTSIRQEAASVTQIEIMPEPPESRDSSTPWPMWPYQKRSSSSHKEGCTRMWDILTKSFEGDSAGNVRRVNVVKVEWEIVDGRPVKFKEVPGSEFVIEADLVLLAMGFTGAEKKGALEQFGIELDKRGNVKADSESGLAVGKVFAAGDAASGASLVVRAIAAGKKLAQSVNKFLS
ncbi:MAG: glutamate synthase [Lentisphaerae bacterium GWF2_45_14]|nr:MAG: glutamate synthase [Lentisphaerae bacterium GWF2_45_14]